MVTFHPKHPKSPIHTSKRDSEHPWHFYRGVPPAHTSYKLLGAISSVTHNPPSLLIGDMMVDCEQSLFFFRFSESNACAREQRSRETRETRAAAREEKRVSRFAPSVTRVAICVSRVLLDGLQKKERLLVV